MFVSRIATWTVLGNDIKVGITTWKEVKFKAAHLNHSRSGEAER